MVTDSSRLGYHLLQVLSASFAICKALFPLNTYTLPGMIGDSAKIIKEKIKTSRDFQLISTVGRLIRYLDTNSRTFSEPDTTAYAKTSWETVAYRMK
jgi:hypothetical protein